MEVKSPRLLATEKLAVVKAGIGTGPGQGWCDGVGRTAAFTPVNDAGPRSGRRPISGMAMGSETDVAIESGEGSTLVGAVTCVPYRTQNPAFPQDLATIKGNLVLGVTP